jgi:hypothetical protein
MPVVRLGEHSQNHHISSVQPDCLESIHLACTLVTLPRFRSWGRFMPSAIQYAYIPGEAGRSRAERRQHCIKFSLPIHPGSHNLVLARDVLAQ